jgi:tetratricopeptide (TPR) repeat protein
LGILETCLSAWEGIEDQESNPTIYTYIRNHMAVANHWSGNFEKSAESLFRVKEKYEEMYPEGHFSRGHVYGNLRNLYLSLSRPQEALHFADSFKIGRDKSSLRSEEALVNLNMGKCYLDLGDFVKARQLLTFSLRQCERYKYTLSQAQ